MGPGFFYYHRGPDGRQVRRVLLFLAISGLLAFVLYAGALIRFPQENCPSRWAV